MLSLPFHSEFVAPTKTTPAFRRSESKQEVLHVPFGNNHHCRRENQELANHRSPGAHATTEVWRSAFPELAYARSRVNFELFCRISPLAYLETVPPSPKTQCQDFGFAQSRYLMCSRISCRIRSFTRRQVRRESRRQSSWTISHTKRPVVLSTQHTPVAVRD